MTDVTERVRTSLYLLDSGSVNSLPSLPQHVERLLATSVVFVFKNRRKLIELVRKREKLRDVSNKKYSNSVVKKKSGNKKVKS